jgi:hypothetical protein
LKTLNKNNTTKNMSNTANPLLEQVKHEQVAEFMANGYSERYQAQARAIRCAETFGRGGSSYSRAQAIEDGVLVDVSEALTPCPFKYPVAMSRAAYEATIAAGGKWVSQSTGKQYLEQLDASEVLELPGGQDVQGRLHDVFTMALAAIRRSANMPIRRGISTDGIWFSVLVDTYGNGRKTKVDLYSVCGPGDTAAPVITIMLRGED